MKKFITTLVAALAISGAAFALDGYHGDVQAQTGIGFTSAQVKDNFTYDLSSVSFAIAASS